MRSPYMICPNAIHLQEADWNDTHTKKRQNPIDRHIAYKNYNECII